MVERDDRPVAPTFFVDGERLMAGQRATLPPEVANHARVRRLEVGEPVRLIDGAGTVAEARIERLDRRILDVAVGETTFVRPPATLRMFVPVADRDRTLWLAEKCTEIGVTSWTTVMFSRSRGVASRGEGDAFARKLRARMIAALEQSGGAWLPSVSGTLSIDEALGGALPNAPHRFVLEKGAPSLLDQSPRAGAEILLGPEGGLERAEFQLIVDRYKFIPVGIGSTTLRFETAGLLAAGIVRGRLDAPWNP